MLSDEEIEEIAQRVGGAMSRAANADPLDPMRPYRGLDVRSRVPEDIGNRFQAHGITSGDTASQLRQLRDLIKGGIDPNREFHTGTLSGQSNDPTLRAAGLGFKDEGHFAVVGAPDKSMREEGIKYVLTSEHMNPEIPRLQKEFPSVEFIPYGQEEEFLGNDLQVVDTRKAQEKLKPLGEKVKRSEESELASGGPLLDALASLAQRMESLEQTISETGKQQPGGYQYQGVAGELGGGISGITQRDALEAARKQIPGFDSMGDADRKAHVIAEYQRMQEQTHGMTPTMKKLHALQRSGASPQAVQSGMEAHDRLERIKAQEDKERAEADVSRGNWGLFGRMTGWGGLARDLSTNAGYGDAHERLEKAERTLSRPPPPPVQGSDKPPPFGVSNLYAGLGSAAADALSAPQAGALGAQTGPESQELISVLRELIAALKSGQQQKQAAEVQPGIQPDGSFIPAGPGGSGPSGDFGDTVPSTTVPRASSGAMPPWLPGVLRTP